jgi:hypothetical protein
MKLRLRYLIICVWTFSLLVSTIGVRLYAVYCYCLNQTTYSLFNTENHLVTAFADISGCCSAIEETSTKSCCSPVPIVSLPYDSKISFSDPGCMKTSSKQLVLSVDLNDVPTLVKNVKIALPIAIPLPSIPVYTLNISLLSIPDHTVPPEPPPCLSGRSICLLHEIARC